MTILASVDWSKIDADLVGTRDTLAAARRSLADLHAGVSAVDRQRVKDEIEKLEAFVTSSKFEYYDKAASDTTVGSEAEP